MIYTLSSFRYSEITMYTSTRLYSVYPRQLICQLFTLVYDLGGVSIFFGFKKWNLSFFISSLTHVNIRIFFI